LILQLVHPSPSLPRVRGRVRVGAELGGLVGSVPALHDLPEFVGPLVGRVAAEPRRLDHAAALRRRHLLVLAGDPRDEVPGGLFADRAADVVEGRAWLALRVQCLAASADKQLRAELAVEHPGLVVLGDRRKANHLPILPRHHAAGEIVPRVTPEGRLSCSRCMITMIAPVLVSLSRL
jgi:hypothetical protein